MSRRVINPYQLKMIATGAEIQDMATTSGDLAPGEDMPALWDRKQRAASDPTNPHGYIEKSLLEHGYQEPQGPDAVTGVHLMYGGGDQKQVALADAHHRVAAAAHLERTGQRAIWFPLHHSVPDSADAAPPKPPRHDPKFVM